MAKKKLQTDQNRGKQLVKKIIYVLFSTILGVLLSFIIHGGVEIVYIRYLEDNNQVITPHYFFGNSAWCALPVWVQAGLLILGIVGGFFLGLAWWNKVYVQKRHRKFRQK